MPDVTRIIAGLVISVLFLGCGNKPPKSKPDFSSLPQQVNLPEIGKAAYILPEALIDSLNRGAKLRIFFLQESPPENPDWIVPLPGMEIMFLGDIWSRLPKLPHNEPLYLICLYGDDSSRMAREVVKEGLDCYYLDGGIYRLYTEIRKGNLRLKTKS